MLDFAIKKWDKNKDELKEYFTKHKQDEYAHSYESFTKKVIEIIFNDDDYGYENGDQYDAFDLKSHFQEIDFGNYQGTLIFVFAYDTYQPSTNATFYTSVDYGSCSVCDTLQAICEYGYDETPTERQVNDYMKLALNLIQKMKCMGE